MTSKDQFVDFFNKLKKFKNVLDTYVQMLTKAKSAYEGEVVHEWTDGFDENIKQNVGEHLAEIQQLSGVIVRFESSFTKLNEAFQQQIDSAVDDTVAFVGKSSDLLYKQRVRLSDDGELDDDDVTPGRSSIPSEKSSRFAANSAAGKDVYGFDKQ